jgi:hypothetical protein
MGFFRQQEEKLVIKWIKWQYQKQNYPLPDEAAIKRNAVKIVEEGHRIAREKGRNIYGIMKELVDDLKKEK